MAKIVMREMQTGTAQSDGKMYPHLISMGVKTMEDVCEHLGRETTMNPAEIRAAVAMLAKELAMWMWMGYTVRVDALGTFRPALRLKKGAEQEKEKNPDGLFHISASRPFVIHGDMIRQKQAAHNAFFAGKTILSAVFFV